MYSSKDALRQAMMRIRNSLPTNTLDAMSDTIQNKVISMKEFVSASTIGAYHSIRSEVRTLKIMDTVLQQNKTLALPKVIDDTTIIFAEVKELATDLETGRYKIMEPKDYCHKIEQMDLVLVPGITWDESGHRIGYGLGYYDRYLAKLQTLCVGLAYDFQIFEEIPHSKNDFRVHIIVTEKRVIRTR
ncbi:MAG: 5-formyltetrahydrofolate cyclo-ligase [Nitrososphaerales archaeon]